MGDIEIEIEWVVFDLGGVLIDWNPRYLYRKLLADSEAVEHFLREVCPPSWNAQHDAGQPFREGIAEATARHPEKGPLIRAYFDRWPEMLGGALAETVALLERVKRSGRAVLALTNWSAETFPVAQRRYSFLGEFEDILVSGAHGLAKPDPAIFELASERFGLDPSKSLFIDDSLRNVEAAARVGFHTHHFRGAEALDERLNTLL